MANLPKPDQLDSKTPPEVVVTLEPRQPTTDPTLGITVNPAQVHGTSLNKLVVIGDSISAGFQSGAIYNTRLSWPRIVAQETGCDSGFGFPLYDGHGGLPLNIEYLLRLLEHKYGSDINLLELPLATIDLRHQMAVIEDYWERGPGATVPLTNAIMHNLSAYGWDIRDVMDRTRRNLNDDAVKPKDNFFNQIVENANIRSALGVYSSMGEDDTLLDAAAKLGKQGALPGSGGDSSTPGIETLVVAIGANNVLGSVTDLEVRWSQQGYSDLHAKNQFNVWNPEHFKEEYRKLSNKLVAINAQHVILLNVPHVTIAPVARGVDNKIERGSRYYPFYTRPWITDEQFNVARDPHITANEARAIDSAIDQYNDTIATVVKERRSEGKDWYVLDLAGVLDRAAARRYIDDVMARPAWWTPYEFPPALNALNPPPNSRFFASGPDGRTQGGLFSLDGIHPTTVAYGLIAQEVINVMQVAKVPFYFPDGKTQRQAPLRVDFHRLIRLDSLVSKPPTSLTSDMKTIGWLDEIADFFGKLNPFSRPRQGAQDMLPEGQA